MKSSYISLLALAFLLVMKGVDASHPTPRKGGDATQENSGSSGNTSPRAERPNSPSRSAIPSQDALVPKSPVPQRPSAILPPLPLSSPVSPKKQPTSPRSGSSIQPTGSANQNPLQDRLQKIGIPATGIPTQFGKEKVVWQITHVKNSGYYDFTAHDVRDDNREAVLFRFPENSLTDVGKKMIQFIEKGLDHRSIAKSYVSRSIGGSIFFAMEKDVHHFHKYVRNGVQTLTATIDEVGQCGLDVLSGLSFLQSNGIWYYLHSRDAPIYMHRSADGKLICQLYWFQGDVWGSEAPNPDQEGRIRRTLINKLVKLANYENESEDEDENDPFAAFPEGLAKDILYAAFDSEDNPRRKTLVELYDIPRQITQRKVKVAPMTSE